MAFIRTFIYCYCRQIYGEKENLGAIRRPESPMLEGEEDEPNGTERYPSDKPAVNPDANQMYCLPELSQEYKQSYRWKLEIPASKLVNYMKENDGSPSSLLSLAMCKAVHKVHPEHEETIASSVVWNCRKELGMDHTRRMCVSSICLDYDERTQKAPMERQLTHFRGKTFAQQLPENAYQDANGLIQLFNMLDRMNSLQEKCGLMEQVLKHQIKTFMVSYIGRMDMGEYEQYIDGVYVYGSGTKGLSMEVVALQDKFCIQFMQSFQGTEYLQAFCDELQKMGIPVTVSKCQTFTIPNASVWASQID